MTRRKALTSVSNSTLRVTASARGSPKILVKIPHWQHFLSLHKTFYLFYYFVSGNVNWHPFQAVESCVSYPAESRRGFATAADAIIAGNILFEKRVDVARLSFAM